MTRIAIALPFLIACSSAAQPADDGGIPHDGGADMNASDADASKQADAASDAASEAQADAGIDPFVPHPPAGATKCGSGAIDSSSAHSSCMEPSMVLDYMPQIDGGVTSVPRSCDALTIGAGEWQAWCTSTSVYLWGRMPITNNGTIKDCHGLSLLAIDLGFYAAGNGGGNTTSVLTYEPNGTMIFGTPASTPQVVVMTQTVGMTTSGSAQMFVAGSIEDSCQNGAFGPSTVLGGFDPTWTE